MAGDQDHSKGTDSAPTDLIAEKGFQGFMQNSLFSHLGAIAENSTCVNIDHSRDSQKQEKKTEDL